MRNFCVNSRAGEWSARESEAHLSLPFCGEAMLPKSKTHFLCLVFSFLGFLSFTSFWKPILFDLLCDLSLKTKSSLERKLCRLHS